MTTVPLILIFISFAISIPSSSASISLNSTLFASNLNQSWISPNQTFSVGFKQLTSNSYIAAISYSGGVPIWTAGDPVDFAASFQFLTNGNLRLVNGSGFTVWQTNTTGLGVTTATLDDSGDLRLLNGSVPVWSSFLNPTDTLVPSQNFTSAQTLRSGQYYSFRLRGPGNLTLSWNDSILYWNQGLNSSVNSNLSSPSLGLQSIGILSIFDVTLPSAYIFAYSNDYAEGSNVLRFLRLDDDGNLRIYSSVMGSGIITERWSAIADQCQVFGFCGNMGICSYNDSSPICGCPSENFELIDPNDDKNGCKLKVRIEDCPGNTTMLNLEHTEFLTFLPEILSQTFFMGISSCGTNCLGSNPCLASTSLSDGSGLCHLKTSTFLSGYQNPSLPSTSYVKVCEPAVPNSNPGIQAIGNSKGRGLRAWVIAVVVIATLLGLIALEGGLWFWCCRNRRNFGGLSAQYALLEYASGAPVQFSYKELHRTTKGFKEKLGAGGFGTVYKGVLANKTLVGVKQLEGIEQGEKQFRMEVATISSTHHLNLVRLIGFCSEGRHRLLVYEFMKNGSLDSFLFTTKEDSGKSLNWAYRFSIALATAKGMTYLHEECRDCIVHCDIKPENILLDENYNAKVSDFGLAKLVNPKDHRHRTLTSVRGTRGYLAPEWLANLPITSKSDVYSYGMVLLEIVSGRRNFEVSGETNRKKFSVWAYEEFEKGNIASILDKRLVGQEVDIQQVKRMVEVCFWCMQEQPSQRPMMGKVVQMLEGVSEIAKPPGPKAFSHESLSSISASINSSSNVSALSTFAASVPASTSLQTVTSGRTNMEQGSSWSLD